MLKFKAAYLLLIVFAIFTATGCGEDLSPGEELNNRLEGSWEVESILISGIEELQGSGGSFNMVFTKEGPLTGETEWTLTDESGITNQILFDYEIENDGERIEIDNRDFIIELNGDDLLLQGIVDNEQWIVRAEKE